MPNLPPDGCPTERYLRYAPRRDAVIALGAGASHPDGVPLQEHLLPMILSEEIRDIADSIIGGQVRRFIMDNFYVNPATDTYPKLEAVFGFLDHFIQQQESLSATYPTTTLREIKENP